MEGPWRRHDTTILDERATTVTTVALVTGEQAPDRITAEEVASVDQPLVDALVRQGVRVDRPCWRDATVPWEEVDVAVVRTTWDYVEDRDAFVSWAEKVGARTSLWNPPDVLRWNTHKGYLMELEERGAPIVPTAWAARGDRVDLQRLLTQRGWSEAIIKPAVGSGSRDLVRVDATTVAQTQPHLEAMLAVGDVLIQPFLPSIATRGELSVVVVDGAVSHSVRKRPRDGDFRVQSEHGGRYEQVTDAHEAEQLAAWVVEVTGQPLLIARVDLVENDAGQLQLIELEATEPDLYLTVVPQAARPLATAILSKQA